MSGCNIKLKFSQNRIKGFVKNFTYFGKHSKIWLANAFFPSANRALINPDSGYPYRNYYAFMMFNKLYQLGTTVALQTSADTILAQAARNGKKAAIVLANPSNEDIDVSLELTDFDFTDVQVLRIDDENRYTLTGESLGGAPLKIPAAGCVEIDLWNLQ
jgi:hypothetical protein